MLTYENCRLCPRKCAVNRSAGQRGRCAMPGQLTAARAMLHYGEEPCIGGGKPVGAVFFSGCNLGCIYCQNREISHGGKGIPLSAAQLREIFLRLIHEGAAAIDLVSPGHFLPEIAEALQPKLPVPVVYNCGGYEDVESLRALEGLVDVYLPDFKYSQGSLAAALSGAEDYFPVAVAALQEMYRQVGSAHYEKGQMLRGMLVRHLVLPGYLENTYGVLEDFARLFPKGDVAFSLMRQYVPKEDLPPPLNRRLTETEYASALSWMELCGIREGYTQGADSATEELLPDFNFEGIL